MTPSQQPSMSVIEFKDPATGDVLAAQVRPEFEDGQPRVRDLDLASWLGYERPSKIRELIRRNRLEIEALGIIPTVGIIHGGAGRPAEELWLTEEQAIAVCQLSQTPRATQVRIMLRRMFVQYRQGALVPVTPSAVVDCTALDRLEVVVAKTSADVAALCAVVAATHTDLCELKSDVGELRSDVGDLKSDVTGLKYEVGRLSANKRRDPKAGDIALMMRVVEKKYDSLCPCCEQTLILNPDGSRNGNWNVDHGNGCWDPRLESLWAVCGACNQRMRAEPGFRYRVKDEFAMYQKRAALLRPKQLMLVM